MPINPVDELILSELSENYIGEPDPEWRVEYSRFIARNDPKLPPFYRKRIYEAEISRVWRSKDVKTLKEIFGVLHLEKYPTLPPELRQRYTIFLDFDSFALTNRIDAYRSWHYYTELKKIKNLTYKANILSGELKGHQLDSYEHPLMQRPPMPISVKIEFTWPFPPSIGETVIAIFNHCTQQKQPKEFPRVFEPKRCLECGALIEDQRKPVCGSCGKIRIASLSEIKNHLI